MSKSPCTVREGSTSSFLGAKAANARELSCKKGKAEEEVEEGTEEEDRTVSKSPLKVRDGWESSSSSCISFFGTCLTCVVVWVWERGGCCAV